MKNKVLALAARLGQWSGMTPERPVIMWPMPNADGSLVHPPPFLDGARVLQVASLSRAQPTGATRHVVNGNEVTDFAALAVAQYDGSVTAYLFYCDSDWRVVTDTEHESVRMAIEQAHFEFGLLQFKEV